MTIAVRITNTGHLPVDVLNIDKHGEGPDTVASTKTLAVGEEISLHVWQGRDITIKEPKE